jgi:hypothetical protein
MEQDTNKANNANGWAGVLALASVRASSRSFIVDLTSTIESAPGFLFLSRENNANNSNNVRELLPELPLASLA